MATVDHRLRRQLEVGGNTPVRVVVELRGRASLAVTGGRNDRQREVVRRLHEQADTGQRALIALLDTRRRSGTVSRVESLWASNSIAITATPDVVREIAARSDVAAVVPDAIDVVPLALPAAPTANLAPMHPDQLWADGALGSGVVIASLDTGVNVTHPDLAASYRGGANSWKDPYAQHATPVDSAGPNDTGHGTATMGLMVGGDASGESIGMAPGAKWIAAKIFDDAGHATVSAIQTAMQWVLDPDGNPLTADAPSIVNNSWGLNSVGCDTTFQANVQAWRAAGIVPVFAAGNVGPGASTDTSPGNYPESLSVGAVGNDNSASGFSSEGPSACGGRSRVFPDVVAPGANNTSAAPGGLYYEGLFGTSFSAPEVSGALALLEHYRSASTVTPEAALLASAVDLGIPGADDVFGRGVIDVAAARALMLASPTGATTTTSSTTTTTAPTTTTTSAPPPTTTVPPTTTTTTTAPPTTTTTTTTTPATTTTTTTAPAPPPPPLFADGFESRSTRRWTLTNAAGGRLAVGRAAAIDGVYGLQARLAPGLTMTVVDRSPARLRRYHARFRYDPNGSTVAGAAPHAIFRAYDSGGRVVLEVQVRVAAGRYQLRTLTLVNDLVTRVPTPWTAVADAPHTVEVAFTAASSMTATNGGFLLWIDGIVRGGRSNLANGRLRIDEIRMGPQQLPAGSAGVEHYDSFVSTTGAYVGR